jgi:hypothetical protein
MEAPTAPTAAPVITHTIAEKNAALGRLHMRACRAGAVSIGFFAELHQPTLSPGDAIDLLAQVLREVLINEPATAGEPIGMTGEQFERCLHRYLLDFALRRELGEELCELDEEGEA